MEDNICSYNNNILVIIKINPEYEKLVPELSEHDFQSLKKSIMEDSAAHIPIFVNPKREIPDLGSDKEQNLAYRPNNRRYFHRIWA